MTAKTYRILPGYSFRDSDDSIKTGGQTIALSPDVAATLAHQVELVEPQANAAPAAPDATPPAA